MEENKSQSSETKKEPAMFKVKGKEPLFYVKRAVKHYTDAEAELRTIVKMGYVTEDELKSLKEAASLDIDALFNDLYTYLSGTPMEKVVNDKLEELYNKISKKTSKK